MRVVIHANKLTVYNGSAQPDSDGQLLVSPEIGKVAHRTKMSVIVGENFAFFDGDSL